MKQYMTIDQTSSKATKKKTKYTVCVCIASQRFGNIFFSANKGCICFIKTAI